MQEQTLTTEKARTDTRAQDARGLAGFLKVLFRRTMADKVPVLAAALSFFMMLSIVPVILLALAILGFVISQMGYTMQQAAEVAVNQMQKGISQVLPGASVQDTFRQLADQINLEDSLIGIINARGITMVTGLLSLLWASMQIFVSASPLMNFAFDAEETRSWLKLRLTALGVTLGAAVLFLLSLIPTSGPDFIRNLNIPWLGLPDPTPFWVDALFSLLALAINTALFAFVYKVLPNTRVSWRDALVGGAAVAVLWEIAKKGFALFLAGSDNPMYGALGGVILLITWMYYTNILLLLGAEVAGLYRRVRVGAAAPSLQEARLLELQAVREGRAEPLPAVVPRDEMLEAAKERARAMVDTIKGEVQETGASVSSIVHDVRTTGLRHRAGRALQEPAEERSQDIPPSPPERVRKAMPPREVAGVRGGETPDPDAARREAEREAQEERAARELAADAYPPVKESRREAAETVKEIREHIQEIGETVKRAKGSRDPAG